MSKNQQGILAAAIICIAVLLISSPAYAQKLRLRSNINPDCLTPGGNTTNLKFADIYADGNLAVQGTYSCRGVFIYDLTNPDAPVVASRYNPGNSIQFLEAIVVGNRGYFGSGNSNGVHIVDLTNPASPQLLGIVNSSNGNGFNSIHEMVVDGNLLYENFNGFSNKLIKVINVSDPANPVFVRDISPTEVNWVHAMHIRGNRMFTSGWGNSSNRGRTEIYNIANITTTAPTLLGFVEDTSSTTAGNSMHSSWSSEDGNYLYSARETNNGSGDIRVYNITNPATPVLVNNLTMNGLELNAVTPHNPVVMGNYLYVAWYQAGIQVFDITERANPKRVGQYDMYSAEFAPSEAEKSLLTDSFDIICGNENLQNLLPNTYDGTWAVFPFLGQSKILAGDMLGGLYVLDASKIAAPLSNPVSDFDGDGKTDYSKYTPSTGRWQVENSSNGTPSQLNFGLSQDKIVSADYDGDGKSDIAVWRPSDGNWYIKRSSDSNFDFRHFGATGDIPVPADFDADGKADLAVFRPSNGVWYISQSSMGFKAIQWGLSTDLPMAADFEGDGKADVAVYRPSNGTWYVFKSSSSTPISVTFGLSTDKPVVGDFNGDGRADYAVYRPSEGNWYVLSSNNFMFSVYRFGIAEDMPIPSDFDGDGKSDIAVYRPSSGFWYSLNSSNSAFNARNYGTAGDIPSPTSHQP